MSGIRPPSSTQITKATKEREKPKIAEDAHTDSDNMDTRQPANTHKTKEGKGNTKKQISAAQLPQPQGINEIKAKIITSQRISAAHGLVTFVREQDEKHKSMTSYGWG